MIRYFLVLALLIFNVKLYAQIDSLKSALINSSSDTAKVRVLIKLGNLKSDSSRNYLDQALDLSKQMKWRFGEGNALAALGQHLYYTNDLDSSIFFWNLSLSAFSSDQKIEPDSLIETRIAEVAYAVAIPHFHKGSYLQAVQKLKIALDIYLQQDNGMKIISCYNLLGAIYFRQDDIDLALEQYQEAVVYALELKNFRLACNAYANIAGVYLERKQYQESLDNFKKSFDIYPEEDSTSRYYTRSNMGQTYKYMGRYEEAESIFLEASDFFEKTENMVARATINNLIAELYVAMERWDDAINYAGEGRTLAKMLGMQNQELESASQLSKAYEAQGNTSDALKYFKEYAALRDSIFLQEKLQEVEVLKAELEYDKQQREISELTQANLEKEVALSDERNTRNIILFSGAGVLLIIGVIWMLYRRSEERRRHSLELKKLEIEQRMLRTQMNPHFIFNALNSIQSFITTNNTYEAEVFMSKFSMLVRKILENSTQKTISLEEEIETLQLYLELEKSRFEERFDFEIIDEADSMLSIPPMLLQPFIENAIIHGMKGKREKGHIYVRFLEKEDLLICEVEDDGVGRSHDQKSEYHKSLATALTNDRISFFNEASESQEYDLEIIDLMDIEGKACGTKVMLVIPLEE